MASAVKMFKIERLSGSIAAYFTIAVSEATRRCGCCDKLIKSGTESVSFKPGSSNPASMCKACAGKLAKFLMKIK